MFGKLHAPLLRYVQVLKLTGGTTRDDIRKAARRQIVMVGFVQASTALEVFHGTEMCTYHYPYNRLYI